jgi:hypothetical protein
MAMRIAKGVNVEKKHLTLNRETLRALEASKLKEIQGASKLACVTAIVAACISLVKPKAC